jgi:multiple sugar transport system substrate-binding protein
MPTWAGESEPWAGAEGGGLWTVSTHSKNKALAADLATFLSTNVDVLKAAATYPAYGPAAEAWIQARSTDAFYASDPTPAMKTEAGLIRSNFNFIRYESQFGDAWETTVVKAAAAGGDIAGALATWGTQITQAATDTGYTVSK